MLPGILLLVSTMSIFHADVKEAKYVAIVAAVVGMPRIALRGIAALRRFILDINVLMMIAVGGAIVLNEYHEAAAIVFLFGFAEWLEDRCMNKARTAVRMLSEMQPEEAVDANTGKSIAVEDVRLLAIKLCSGKHYVAFLLLFLSLEKYVIICMLSKPAFNSHLLYVKLDIGCFFVCLCLRSEHHKTSC